MGTGYTRQSAPEIVDGEDILAEPLNREFNAIRDAMHETSGHSHDGTTGEGPKISLTTSISGVLPVVNGGTGGINKPDATTAPTATDDISEGYAVASIWVDTTADLWYICVDNTDGAAVWVGRQVLDADLTAIAALSGTGILVRTASDTWAQRTITGTSPVTVTNGDGVSGNPTIAIDAATTSTAGSMSALDKTKLDGIATGATANSSDATLLNRANHTGEQAISTVTGLQTELDNINAAIAGGGGAVNLETGVTGTLPVANGGTGSATAAGARSNLGLGSLATASTITNADWAVGGADLAVANGGTGASDASGARTNLGLGDLATQSTINGSNWSGTDLAVVDGGTGSSTAAGARTNLGLGSLATASSINNDNWSGTDLAVVNGGTGASDAATARSNLGAAVSSHTHAASDITSGTLDAARIPSSIQWPGVYTGSDTSNSSFPVGTIVLVTGSDFRNSAATIYTDLSDTALFTKVSGGTALSGTWRARGATGASGAGIYQRTA